MTDLGLHDSETYRPKHGEKLSISCWTNITFEPCSKDSSFSRSFYCLVLSNDDSKGKNSSPRISSFDQRKLSPTDIKIILPLTALSIHTGL
ncbi:unnamed protein product [Blepharisma stoltei]|uniref:Uncharacterized protein n=1 Tax=Blepharisma stoltei TaxID=1481888 RepID=A0AAU9JGC1_9CILI|nr:unnamed protein product [Blepharisma stoltei]